MRYFVHLAFDGTNYQGWQKQPACETVQGRLNLALARALCEPVATDGCGRTDAGVHATDYYAQFSTDQALPPRFAEQLNAFLPADITVLHVFPVDEKASARFSAIARTYQYYVHRDKNPFLRNYAVQLYDPHMDWDKVMAATRLIPTITDFSSLCRPSEDFKTNICNVTEAQWAPVPPPFGIGSSHGDGFMCFTITSNRFLRGMVRVIVGTLMLIGRGRLDPAVFERAVLTQAELPFRNVAPPQGLYLTKVTYPQAVMASSVNAPTAAEEMARTTR